MQEYPGLSVHCRHHWVPQTTDYGPKPKPAALGISAARSTEGRRAALCGRKRAQRTREPTDGALGQLSPNVPGPSSTCGQPDQERNHQLPGQGTGNGVWPGVEPCSNCFKVPWGASYSAPNRGASTSSGGSRKHALLAFDLQEQSGGVQPKGTWLGDRMQKLTGGCGPPGPLPPLPSPGSCHT